MSLNLDGKKEVVAEVAAQVAKSQTLVLSEFRGSKVVDLTKLRADARAKGVYVRVVKNTLARRAVQGTPFEVIADKMVGPMIYSFSEDPVAAAKVVNDFAKGNEKFAIVAGVYSGRALDGEGVKALANIPSKEVLLSQLLSLMQNPMSSLARVLHALSVQRDGGEVAAPAVETEVAVAAEAPAAA